MLRKQLKQRRDRLITSLDELLGDRVEFLVPEGGIHLWCKVQDPIHEYQLLGKAIQNGIAFVPGSVLGSKKEYVRFTFGRAKTDFIHVGITRFVEILDSIR